ncbi:unnamed protein product [Lampetra planeri]
MQLMETQPKETQPRERSVTGLPSAGAKGPDGRSGSPGFAAQRSPRVTCLAVAVPANTAGANRPIQDVATQLDRASTAASEMTSGSRSRRDGRVRREISHGTRLEVIHSVQVCYVGKRCLPYQCSGTETASAGRNGVPVASAGDKAYRAVEYSAGFHLLGSTRAPPRFSAGAKHAADTFIPLQPPPSVPRTPYHKKAQEMQRALEMMEVQALDEWEPPSRASHPRLDGDHD